MGIARKHQLLIDAKFAEAAIETCETHDPSDPPPKQLDSSAQDKTSNCLRAFGMVYDYGFFSQCGSQTTLYYYKLLEGKRKGSRSGGGEEGKLMRSGEEV
eukprot:5598318-Amphidinium_carterae.2